MQLQTKNIEPKEFSQFTCHHKATSIGILRKKHASKTRNKLAISIGYLGVYEQLSQKRSSLKSTKFPFRRGYLRCILLFKSYPILNCALGGEAREKTFDPPCFIRVSHRLGKQNDSVLSVQSLPVVIL